MTGTMAINSSAPNLVCICIDEINGEQKMGCFHHKYSEQPAAFSDLNHLLILLDQLMDRINFPQSSTIQRSFFKTEQKRPRTAKEEEPQVRSAKEILNETGKKGTFVVNVQYRQNATWQGRVLWAETGKSCNFRSALELLKLIDSALDEAEIENKDTPAGDEGRKG